jgi:AP-1 complex subunit gamma-1
VALLTLNKLVTMDAAAVSRHRAVIVECLRDGDVSIRKRALELVYALVAPDNVRALAKEMLAYLPLADEDTKAQLCMRIALVAERFSPSKRWHVDTLLTVLAAAGAGCRPEICNALLFHIAAAEPADHAAVVHKLFALAGAAVAGAGEAAAPLLTVALWTIGEFGGLLLAPPPAKGAGGDDLSGPSGEARSEGEVVRAVERIAALHYAPPGVRAMAVMAALKLTARLPAASGDSQAALRRLIKAHEASGDVELQARAVEFSALAGASAADASGPVAPHRAALLEQIPHLAVDVMQERTGLGPGGAEKAMAVMERTVARGAEAGGGGGGRRRRRRRRRRLPRKARGKARARL